MWCSQLLKVTNILQETQAAQNQGKIVTTLEIKGI